VKKLDVISRLRIGHAFFSLLIATAFLDSVALPSAAQGKDITPHLRLVRTLEAPCHVTTSPAWHPSGKQFATGCNLHRAVTIWDPQSGEVLRTLDKEAGGPWKLAYSPDGRYLAVARLFVPRNNVTLYAADSGVLVRTFSFPAGGKAETLAFSPDSQQVAVGGGRTPVSIFETETGALLRSLESPAMKPDAQHKGSGSVTALAYSPDGKWLVVAYIRGVLEIWRTVPWTVSRQLDTLAPHDLVFSPDGKSLAIGADVFLKSVGELNSPRSPDEREMSAISVLEFPSLVAKRRFPVYGRSPKTGLTIAVASLSYSDDGRLLFSGGAPAKILDASTGAIVKEINFTPTVHFTSPSPDGRYLVVASEKEIRIWEFVRN
jgi:WD40 repeat protein